MKNDKSPVFLKKSTDLKKKDFRVTSDFSKLACESLRDNLFTRTVSDIDFKNRLTSDTEFRTPTMRNTLLKIVEISKTNKKLAKSHLDETSHYIQRKKILDSLNSELNFYVNENSGLRENLKHTEKLYIIAKESNEKAAIYCEKLKEEFRSFVGIIDKYQGKIDAQKDENEANRLKYEEKIAKIENESRIKKKENENFKVKLEGQNNFMSKMNEKINGVNLEIENDKKKFEIIEEELKKQEAELLEKTHSLEKKYLEYKHYEDYKEVEADIEQRMIEGSFETLEKKKLELLDLEHQNEFVQAKIKDYEKFVALIENEEKTKNAEKAKNRAFSVNTNRSSKMKN